MNSEEIIIRYYSKPIPVKVDPGEHHPNYERDLLLGWVCQGSSRRPVLQKFPNAKIVAKAKSRRSKCPSRVTYNA